jgi:organic hydroperoxide reductase OsmC/OhrA
VAARPKVLEYGTAIDAGGNLSAENCPKIELPPEWTAEHLLLAALLRCSLRSLQYHATRAGAETSGGGSARGTITKREADGRYAFAEIEVELDVVVVPGDDVATLLAKAERDCFIGASLSIAPEYRWTVNGVSARAAPL